MAVCYRHPGRETNVACSNCGRPICPDCMTSTPVGMRCPECAEQRTQVRRVSSRLARGAAPATYALLAVNVAAFLAELGAGGGGAGSLEGGGKLIADGGLIGPPIADGEWWRLVSAGFLHAGPLHLAMNMFALYILGTLLEPGIGTGRFVGVYLVALLAGDCGALLLDPRVVTVGASGAIFGLMGAAFVFARHRGLGELASQIGFYAALNIAFTFSVPGISVGGHVGGLLGGGLAALALATLERRGAGGRTPIELLALAILAGAALAGSLAAASAA